MAPNSLYLVVSCAFQDAGDTIRSVAMATAFRDSCPLGFDLKIDFLSCGSRLEHFITDAGFNVIPAQPRCKGINVADDLGLDFPEFFGSKEIAQRFIEGQLAALNELKPDMVFHGMWAPCSIAARLLGIKTINSLPVPLHPEAYGNGIMRDFPDLMPLVPRLPRPIRTRLVWWGAGLLLKAPAFRQKRLGAAAAACGWPLASGQPISLFDMNMADLNLVNDHPIFHADYAYRLPDNIVITGPLFGKSTAELDPEMAAHMKSGPGPAILVTMGSCFPLDWFFEAIKALKMNVNDSWKVVLLSPPSICSLDVARAKVGGDSRFFITDKHVPASAINALADVIVAHGGQGTVQAAVDAGKPIVGVALQMEQQTNLDNVMNAGAGIRIQRHNWKAKNIRQAVVDVLKNPAYAAKARRLGDTVRGMDGAKIAAAEMWKFVLREHMDQEKMMM